MLLPAQIGRYRILGLLGQGAMGVVYRGRDEALDRDVALKVMARALGADVESRERFLREARAAAKLQHANIITIYELGEHEGSPFMALELLEGIDLQRAIEAGIRPDARVTLPVVLQLLSGLAHAHAHGIVHRDVKPSNVFLPRGLAVKIMDFGVARLAGGMTSAGMVVGTPNYMSPEQVRALPVDGRSDLFSAGLILYELVTGERAYQADSMVALFYKIAHEDPDLSLIPGGARWGPLRSVLERALAHDPDDRYPDAGAMVSDLAAAYVELGGNPNWTGASGIGPLARGTTPARPAPSPAGVAPPGPAREDAPRAPRGAWAPRTAGIAGAVVALGLGLWFVGRERGPSSPGGSPAGGIPSATPSEPARPPSTPEPGRPSPAPSAPPPSIAPSPRPTSPPSAPLPTASAPLPTASAPLPTPAAPLPTPAALLPAPATPLPTPLPAPPSVPPAEASLAKAKELFDKGSLAAALAQAKAVLGREPGNAEARGLAQRVEAALVVEDRIKNATELLRRGDKEGALDEIKKGLWVNPSDRRLIELFRQATQ